MKNNCRTFLTLLTFLVLFSGSAFCQDPEETLRDAKYVLEEMLDSPDYDIPSDLLSKAKAIVIFPTMVKGGFIFAARYGEGVSAARSQETGQWGAPSFVTTVGGSFGFQAGAEAVDLVLLVMNRRGIGALLKNKFTLGGDVGIAAGPAGRHAEAGADFKMQAEILSYSRSKGIFGGISLKGTVISTDNESNQLYYGGKVSPENILLEGKINRPPESARHFINQLNKLAPPKKDKYEPLHPKTAE